MADFWHFARLLLRHRLLLGLALVFATFSAGGMGAGLVAIKPILDAVLRVDRPGLSKLGAEWLEEKGKDIPAWLRPSPEAIARLPDDAFDSVILIISLLGVLTLFGAAANFLHQYCSLTLVARTVNRVRREAFEHIVHLPLATILSAPGGRGASDAVSRVVNDSSQLSAGLTALVSKAMAQATKALAALMAAMVLDWRVAGAALLAAPIMGIILRKLGKRIRRASRAALASQAGLYGAATEALAGLRVVKVHTNESREAARFGEQSDEVMRREFKMRTARALSSPLIELVTIIMLGGLALVGFRAILYHQLDRNSFILVIGVLGVAGAQLRPLTGLLNDIQHSSAAAGLLRELFGLPREAPAGHRHAQPAPPQIPPPPHARHPRDNQLEAVTITNPRAPAPALREASFRVESGATVAFVGPNGSGKTTLLSLVPRLFDPDPAPVEPGRAGRVLIDGTDIRTVDLRSLRRQIGVVTQDTVLFSGTLSQNIAYGMEDAGDEAIRTAARLARAEEFILARPEGYGFRLGEGGSGLSGGQRQRIAIARAILRDPAILILDEATSMIDSSSEAEIARAIDEFVAQAHGKRTCLIVAHRLSTVMHADRIVVMDQGRVIDSGDHATLLARCEVYRRIAEHQLVRAPAAAVS
ncbi:MAG: ABC transporter ATP-binding protein [Phycisphaerales bacterium]